VLLSALLYAEIVPCLGTQVIPAFASMMVGAFIAASPVDVRSSTNCPATEAIVEQLLPLLPATVGAAEGQDLAEIEVGAVQAGGAMELHLRLVRPDASLVGDRRLLMQGTCQDMAEAVATVIAAWETRPLPGAIPEEGPAFTRRETTPSRKLRHPSRLPAHPALADRCWCWCGCRAGGWDRGDGRCRPSGWAGNFPLATAS
jgi:hypothetical protein